MSTIKLPERPDGLRRPVRKRALERAAAASPFDAVLSTNLAHAQLASGDLAAALASYERALQLDPQLAVARFGQATALRRSGYFEAAARAYLAAIESGEQTVVGVNRCGRDPQHVYTGESMIVDPRGTVLARAGHDLHDEAVAQGSP